MPPLMIALIAVFAAILLGVIGRALFIWVRNNNSPRETAEAKVVTKRMKVQGFGRTMAGRNSVTGMGSSTYTHYFVTFELEKGKRLEYGAAVYVTVFDGDWCGIKYNHVIGWVQSRSCPPWTPGVYSTALTAFSCPLSPKPRTGSM